MSRTIMKTNSNLFFLVFIFVSFQIAFFTHKIEHSHHERDADFCFVCVFDTSDSCSNLSKISFSVEFDKKLAFKLKTQVFKQNLYTVFLPRSPPSML